jgi:hypothetical protein
MKEMKPKELEWWRALLAKGDGNGLVAYHVAENLHAAGLIVQLPPKAGRTPYVFVQLTVEAKQR